MKREVEDGVPIARVARRYGVSRQSVYSVLKAPIAVERLAVPSKLDPFKEHVKARLLEFDLPATVLLRAAIHRARLAALQLVTQRALIHTELPGDTTDGAVATQGHFRARQLPPWRLRHARLPSTRKVPELASERRGKVGVR